MYLRIHRFLPFTRVEGPGERACIWVQGCPIHCQGCGVPWTWREDAGTSIGVRELAERILTGPAIEGVTFVGGEPFAQAEGLAHLAEIVGENGLSVVTFTGYQYEDLCASGRADWQALLARTDLLIDGPFKRELASTSRPWVGSLNQRYHFLTPRYRHLETQLNTISNKIEVRLSPDGHVEVNGLASSEVLQQLFADVARTIIERQ